ncbi:mannose-1-phosphate guanylyltransferase/mannose-6-phosphate isomerase [Phaeobacter gallaeciensis]|uniref:mannose-1-phosphate guanylyltransferase/mannose-6-phosphate isomerase n=1 Tax=Phaeobacter gallaeciensis TaxID=60890 RepID=UPI00237EEF01|nr:mannose-1-phosphate guanylyltransferase/mannose-6-phosphate isomerase [Phaeobacter gallaeciensis]MDE4193124.1 mannose-1-phosphate guanylyltransferase/mannose-6-phosphate isomerase [Phaeobacter gallaeciensis]MDE4201435.1 mannose-1-phosphate guanylyltransferase/mannose-6-phosphate isomerase [Phaeobacter gallaeciensis]MDE4205615.1 mannose-1-phosphate guanylyltransferase/mannose-6-phosphate isomerase [Phaeobacter gallaeciensis]MDE4209792.1 mannose-1-phosphate guanylyltransferase/mannose-6-phosph
MSASSTITPILLCGGSGTRLWPLSRKSYPKQFVPLVGEETLFQASAKRLSGTGYAAPMVLTNSDFRFIVTEQLAGIGIDPGAVLIEPAGRNTAPAVLAAALYLEKSDPEGLMLVAPSDHVVPDAPAFRAAVAAGQAAAEAGQIVTFGIKPTHAETGYGYLELDGGPGDFTPRAIGLKRFVEKPDAARAEEMLASGQFLWNAGIFLFSVKTILAAFRAHAPELLAPVTASITEGAPDLGFLRLDPAAWDGCPDISIDYAVMEKADNLTVVPFAAGWSDLGGWDAVWRESGPDDRGVVTSGAATAIDCENSLIRSEDDALEVVGIGLKDVITVAMPDAVLVADASRAQDVKLAVAALKEKSAKQATEFPMDHRPWGWFESLAVGERFQVKRIHVHPGAALSLQSHHHRSEHWIVVEGTAKVTVDDEVRLVTENQSVYIPLGSVHRMENPGKVPMVLIEVQTGSYLGEDDIIRYEDVYARGQGAKG